MKKIFLIWSLFCLFGCQTNYFEDFYNDEEQELQTYIPRKRNEDVKVIDTIDLENTLKRYEKDYIVLGTSAFNGHWCSRSLAVDLAKEKGATLVVIGIKPTGATSNTVAIAIPQANTIYHSGSISGQSYTSGNVYASNGAWANYNSSTTAYGSYSGTSTYYTTNTIYKQINNYYFDQYAFFMAKKNKLTEEKND